MLRRFRLIISKRRTLMNGRVVITGGGSGIGQQIAQNFFNNGYRVAVCDVSKKNLHKLKNSSKDILTFHADVTNKKDMNKFKIKVTEEFNGLDIMISNAGVAGPAGMLEAATLKDWKNCLSVNLDGAFLSCKWAAEIMRVQRSGLILIISSTSGLFGVPYRAPYVTAKWGLIGLTKTLAMELGPFGVRVNAICPGSVDGQRLKAILDMESKASGIHPKEIEKKYTQAVSLRRNVKAQDIADMALFLASDSAKQISGQAIAVDGNTERMV